MKTAFLFPGQGSQYVGMGKDLYEEYPAVRELYDEAEEILQFPLKRISFEGPEEELKQTRYTQPAIFVHSLAVEMLVRDGGLEAGAAAGHSLGEYTALVSAGALSWQEGLRLVKIRGELMYRSGEKNAGTMAAIIGLGEKEIEQICEEASEAGIVQPANFNSPGQIVISGSVEGVHRAMELARARKARLVTELVVSGAFHSPLMVDALDGLTYALDETEFKTPQIPIYSNVKAEPVTDPDEIRDLLKQQLTSPVLWQKIIERMVTDGYRQFYELGPSRVLCGLNKRITREAKCTPLGKAEELKELVKVGVV